MKIWLFIVAILGIASGGVAQSTTKPKGLAVGDYLRVDYVDELHEHRHHLRRRSLTVLSWCKFAKMRIISSL